MNKGEFITYMSEKNDITKLDAEKTINMFTNSVTEILGSDKEISLVGFGNFHVAKVAARKGRNPQTGKIMDIPAYNQPKFKAGKALKSACNK